MYLFMKWIEQRKFIQLYSVDIVLQFYCCYVFCGCMMFMVKEWIYEELNKFQVFSLL